MIKMIKNDKMSLRNTFIDNLQIWSWSYHSSVSILKKASSSWKVCFFFWKVFDTKNWNLSDVTRKRADIDIIHKYYNLFLILQESWGSKRRVYTQCVYQRDCSKGLWESVGPIRHDFRVCYYFSFFLFFSLFFLV